MTKIKLFIVFTASMLMQACINSPSSTLNDLKYFELFKPIIHQHDSQEYVLSDYMKVDQIDSIRSENYKVHIVDGRFTLTSTKDVRQYSELKIFSDGVPYSLPVFKTTDPLGISAINSIQFTLNKQSVDIKRTKNSPCFAYWNNLSLAIDSTESNYHIDLPPFAKYFDNSHLVIYQINEFKKLEVSVVPIKKSKIIVDLKNLRQDQVQNGIGLSNYSIDCFLDRPELIKAFNNELIENPQHLALVYGTTRIIESNDTMLVVEKTHLEEKYIVGFNKSSERLSINEFDKPLAPNSFVYKANDNLFEVNH
ncbi:MAG: hypothetical protein JXR19_03960 [Bacteroidia bacterium]